MKFIRAIVCCCVLLALHPQAHAIKATTAHTLFFSRNSQDSTLYDAKILLSWNAQNPSFHFRKDEKGKLTGKLGCIIRWVNDTGIYKEDIFSINTPPQSTYSEAMNQFIGDQYLYTLPPGFYDLEMVLFEPDYKDQLYHYKDTIRINPFIRDTPFVSGIEILDTFFTASVNTPYTRDGHIYLPLTGRFLDEQRGTLLYYYEAYEAGSIPTDLWPLAVSSYVSWKPYGSPVPGFERSDTLSRNRNRQYFTRSFDLARLYSGNYYLNILLADKNNRVLDKRNVFLQRYSTASPVKTEPKEPAEQVEQVTDSNGNTHVLDLTPTFVGKYTAAQVRAVLRMLLLIANPAEAASIRGFLSKPDELYSKYFIYNFWEKRDKLHPDKAWKAYAEKIREANRLFSSGSVPGFETDRGRIYIQYGKPNDRIIVNNETGSLPYEIWQYYNTDKQGMEGVFLFYKPGRSLNGYELLHSTFVGEKRNGAWRSLLYNNSITGSGDLNNASQAEQYIGNR